MVQGRPPPDLALESVSSANLEALRALNRTIFPINYTAKTYADILACGPVTQLALSQGRVIGAIACRLEQTAECIQLYIITLGVLAPYRRCGIAAILLSTVLDYVRHELPEVSRAQLHVHTINTEAITLYRGAGFEAAEELPGYYRRLDPPDALLLRLKLQPAPDTHDSELRMDRAILN
ncbi:hypothetical protein H632_c1143p1 [Helicosporidium sp. ATCC 50920]|nr:hypothetical protein H632_c1143p1 [Helicosporidium sp. ATCC 50920]|eukprot:KDD74672.1 hypothetical protein H632_c1143p1 [Helicosporidium sp. ATCC 50920]